MEFLKNLLLHLCPTALLAACSRSDETAEVRRDPQAAEQGDAKAQRHLGDRYYLGAGVPKDATEALRWYRLAAEKGMLWRKTLLGSCMPLARGYPGILPRRFADFGSQPKRARPSRFALSGIESPEVV